MKRILAYLLASVISLSGTACSCSRDPPQEVVVYEKEQAVVPEATPEPTPTTRSATLDISLACSTVDQPEREVYDQENDVWTRVPGTARQLSDPPRIATGVALLRTDGTSVHFSDLTARLPDLAEEEDGGWRLTVHYAAVGGTDLANLLLTDGKGFTVLSTRLPAVLATQGLTCASIEEVLLRVDGSEVGRAVNLAVTPQQEVQRVDLPDEFGQIGPDNASS